MGGLGTTTNLYGWTLGRHHGHGLVPERSISDHRRYGWQNLTLGIQDADRRGAVRVCPAPIHLYEEWLGLKWGGGL